MDIVNAIAKVRFSSARPQRINIHKSGQLVAELLCLEPGQEVKVNSGQRLYYVIRGTATLATADKKDELPMGQFAAAEPDEKHSIINASEQRVICLTVGYSG